MTTLAAAPRVTRIGVFYDGNFFAHVSNYYRYVHARHARISVRGLHTFIRYEVARLERTELCYCQIVDAHYFRGRRYAHDLQDRSRLFRDRIFEDVLMREGVTTHFLPLGPHGEKGVDVWFALEALELAMHKQFDVIVLIACDGDYIPLVRKLSTLGTRVMLLAWDFDFLDETGTPNQTRTSQGLIDEVTYPLMMNELVEERLDNNAPSTQDFFMPPASRETQTATDWVAVKVPFPGELDDAELERGTIETLREGYGFIRRPGGPDIYFFHADLINCEIDQLKIGDRVRFRAGENERGPCARLIRRMDPDEEG